MRMLFVATSLLLATAAVAKQARTDHPAALPDGPGKAQVESGCVGCHDMSVVMAKHLSVSGWDEVVQQMVSRGAVVSDADYDAVVAYLAKHYGPVK